MGDRVDLTVVVPVYRNAPTLAPLTTQIIDVLTALGASHEILFVNDASPDESRDRLREIAARHACVTLLDLPENVGQHAAVLHGLARASGRACAIMDADLQDRPSSLATLWQARTATAAAVYGARRGRYEGRGRHRTSRLFKWVLHRLAGVPKDAGLFVLLERELVDALVRFPTRFPWIQAMVGCLGVPVRCVAVERDARMGGESSYTAFGRLKTAGRALLCVAEYRVWRARAPYVSTLPQPSAASLAGEHADR
jgi:glycosyltransferase involved in cell wall biosynthesis